MTASAEDAAARLKTLHDLQKQVKTHRHRSQYLRPSLCNEEQALAEKKEELMQLQVKLRESQLRRQDLMARLAGDVMPETNILTVDTSTSLADTSFDLADRALPDSRPRTPKQQFISHHTPTSAVLTSVQEDQQGMSGTVVKVRRVSFSPQEPTAAQPTIAELCALVRDQEQYLAQRLIALREKNDKLGASVTLSHEQLSSTTDLCSPGALGSASCAGGDYNLLSQSLKREHDRQEERELGQAVRDLKREVALLTARLDESDSEERATKTSQMRSSTGHSPRQAAYDPSPRNATTSAQPREETVPAQRFSDLEKEFTEASRQLNSAEKALWKERRERDQWKATVKTLEERLQLLRKRSSASPELIEVMRRHQTSAV